MENTSSVQANENLNLNDKCIFVSGIPYDSTEDQLKEIFAPCGLIKIIKLPKYQDSGRNIGYAHIYFKKSKSAEKALELNNTHIGQRYITVSISKGEKETKYSRKADEQEVPQGCTTIFVKNLPYDISEEEVGHKFKPCGEIKSIRFVYNTSHNHFKGFCYIEFENSDSVAKSLQLHGKEIKGRKMHIDYEESGPKKGFKYRSEKPSKFNKDYNNILQKKRKRKNN